jgi:hypothetical protein
LLLPGLLLTLFSYKIAAVNGLYEMSEKTENTLAFAKELWESGSHSGFFFVVTFAMVIPVVKLVLLCLGGIYRHRDREEQVELARRCISFVQKISKWASPDMFAYILFLNLVRGLNDPPTLNGLMELDLGFSCFSTFCVASTISSLGVRSPPSREKVPPISSKLARKSALLAIASVLFALGFVALLVHGITKPCMALRLDMDALFSSGQLSMSMKPIIEMLHIQEGAAADVSLLDCMRNLWGWTLMDQGDGTMKYEVNAFLGWVMLAIFVVSFTVVDMVALVVLAVQVALQAHKEGGTRPWTAFEMVHIFRKLSMLDVAIMGIVIIVTAGQIYARLGVILTLKEGLVFLIFAELVHYGLYFLATTSALSLPISTTTEEQSDEEEDDTSSGGSDGSSDEQEAQCTE